MIRTCIIITLIVLFGEVLAQHPHESAFREFTRQDTLRGSVTPEREWWQLTYYHLDVEVIPSDSSLNGSVTIQYRVLKSPVKMQIDLQPPMRITRVTQNHRELNFVRDGNAWFVKMEESQEIGSIKELKVFYQGRPRVSRRPPWDAVITWAYDENGKPFIATACQGDGILCRSIH